MDVSRLLAELRRRKVFRVAGVYAVTTWILVQVVATTAPLLRLPEWVPTLVLVLLLLGFPLAVALAWAFDLTPEGLTRTGPAADTAGGAAGRDGAWAPAVLAVLVVAIGAGAYALGRGGEREVGERSIAVLPFANVSGVEENEYFSDGITEDILTRLAELEGLRVISRTSVMTYKGSDKTVPEIARELGVTYVLEGSVRRVEDRVRITGQLIDARTDEHLWAESYDREIADVLALQGEIAAEIARALALELSPREQERLGRAPTASAVAYEHYLRGREQLRRRTSQGLARSPETIAEAIAHFRRALGADSLFAPAHLGLSEAYARQAWLTEMQEQSDSALAHARRATELDPELPDAYVQLGRVHGARYPAVQYDLYRIALHFNPNHSGAHLELGGLALLDGRTLEALRSYKRAVALDPNNGEAWSAVGRIYRELGYHEQAEAAHRRAGHEPQALSCELGEIARVAGDTAALRRHLRDLVASPPAGDLLRCASALHEALGEYAEAERYLQAFVAAIPEDIRPVWGLSGAYLAQRNGRPAEAERLLRDADAFVQARAGASEEEISRASEAAHARWSINVARVHALRGEKDAAVRALEAASRRFDVATDFAMRHDSRFRDLRGHPGYEALRARLEAGRDALRAQVEREGLHR